MAEEKIITKEKLEELKERLKEYKTKKRSEIARRIKEAKEYGDLSENSEYEEAKNQQAFVEGKIVELEDIIKNAKVLDKSRSTDGGINAGSKIVLKDKSGKKYDYTLVGALEGDPASGKISVESPLGQALLEKKKGEKMIVDLPAGKVEFHILSVK